MQEGSQKTVIQQVSQTDDKDDQIINELTEMRRLQSGALMKIMTSIDPGELNVKKAARATNVERKPKGK